MDRHAEEQRLLGLMNDIIGTKHVSLSVASSFTAPWIVDASLHREMENWRDAFVAIPFADLPANANYIRSHVFCHVKDIDQSDGTTARRLKTRIVLHGNEDCERDIVRKDTQAASFLSIRLLLTIAALSRLSLASVDIRGAYMQSDPCPRDIYVRPPNECRGPRSVVWKLLKLPYGLPDAGHQWQTTIDTFLHHLGFQPTHGIPQVFVQMDQQGNPIAFVVTVVGDLLAAAAADVLAQLTDALQARFDVGRLLVDSHLTFNGAHISIGANGFTLDMTAALARL
jgi:hypothetical protein